MLLNVHGTPTERMSTQTTLISPWQVLFPFCFLCPFHNSSFLYQLLNDDWWPPLPSSRNTLSNIFLYGSIVWCAMPQEIALHVVMIYIGNFVAAFTYNCQEVVGSRGNMAGKYRAPPALPGRADAKRPIIYTANSFFIHTSCSILATCQIYTLSPIFDLFLLQ